MYHGIPIFNLQVNIKTCNGTDLIKLVREGKNYHENDPDLNGY